MDEWKVETYFPIFSPISAWQYGAVWDSGEEIHIPHVTAWLGQTGYTKNDIDKECNYGSQ